MIKRFVYFFKKRLRPFIKKKTVHFIGDSHADVFWYMEFSPFYFWKIKPSIKIVHGATATGLANPNSQTKAIQEFKTYLSKEIQKDDFVVFQLGEVDCGFAIWYRAEKHGISINEQMKIAIKNYGSLINHAINVAGNNVIVTSAVLPTIKDNQSFGEVANLRKEVKQTIKRRTELSLSFNQSLKKLVEEKGISFLEMDDDLLNKNTGVINSDFLHPDPLDHHLNPGPLSKIIYPKLIRLIFN